MQGWPPLTQRNRCVCPTQHRCRTGYGGEYGYGKTVLEHHPAKRRKLFCFKVAFFAVIQKFAVELAAVYPVCVFALIAVAYIAILFVGSTESFTAEFFTAFIADVYRELFHSTPRESSFIVAR